MIKILVLAQTFLKSRTEIQSFLNIKKLYPQLFVFAISELKRKNLLDNLGNSYFVDSDLKFLYL